MTGSGGGNRFSAAAAVPKIKASALGTNNACAHRSLTIVLRFYAAATTALDGRLIGQ